MWLPVERCCCRGKGQKPQGSDPWAPCSAFPLPPELWSAQGGSAGSGWERSLCLYLTKIAKFDLARALGDEAWCYSWLVPEPAAGMSGAALDEGAGAGRELL